MTTTKITVKIYEPLLNAFDKQINGLFIKRDAYLNHMIKIEVPFLAEELKNKVQSDDARRHVAGRLKKLGTKPVNITVEKATASALNKVVAETNLVRDAFVNRLIMYLRSTKPLLKSLELPTEVSQREFKSGYEDMPTSPLLAMDAVLTDPLYYLRLAAEERFNTGLYLLGLKPLLAGFSCYLPDIEVPGTKEYEVEQKTLEEAFGLLDLASIDPKAKARRGK